MCALCFFYQTIAVEVNMLIAQHKCAIKVFHRIILKFDVYIFTEESIAMMIN